MREHSFDALRSFRENQWFCTIKLKQNVDSVEGKLVTAVGDCAVQLSVLQSMAQAPPTAERGP